MGRAPTPRWSTGWRRRARAIDLASPLFEQIVATYAIARLDEILDERRELIRTRRDALAERSTSAARVALCAAARADALPVAELPEPISTSLSLEASRHGLHLTPGPRFAAAGLLERHLRLPFTLAPDQLERAVEILADLTPGQSGARPLEAPASYVA